MTTNELQAANPDNDRTIDCRELGTPCRKIPPAPAQKMTPYSDRMAMDERASATGQPGSACHGGSYGSTRPRPVPKTDAILAKFAISPRP
jgi:hypothetical protein